MWLDRVMNQGPLALVSDTLQTVQRGLAVYRHREVDKTRNFHGITENSDKYGNVRGIVTKHGTLIMEIRKIPIPGLTENSNKYGNVRGIVNKTRNFDNGNTENSDKYGNVCGIVNKTRNFDIS